MLILHNTPQFDDDWMKTLGGVCKNNVFFSFLIILSLDPLNYQISKWQGGQMGIYAIYVKIGINYYVFGPKSAKRQYFFKSDWRYEIIAVLASL